jgi:hypothetical protein
MRQLKTSLEDDDIAYFERAAKERGRSLSEEIRLRLDRSIQQDRSEPATQELRDAIDDLANYVFFQCGIGWEEHPAATRIMRDAIAARLKRMVPDYETATFTADELRESRKKATLAASPLLTSDDQSTWGAALEALAFHSRQKKEGK